LRHAELLGRLVTSSRLAFDAGDDPDATISDTSDAALLGPGTPPEPVTARVSGSPVAARAESSLENRSINDPIAEDTSISLGGIPHMLEVQEEPQVLKVEKLSVKLSLPSASIALGSSSEARNLALPTPLDVSASQSLKHDSPQAIYARYVVARAAWYAAQPVGSLKTNQLYRKAKGLPLRYDRQSYEWCLDYKQMSRRCISPSGARDWSKEEMMAYLDWSKAEDERIEAYVAAEMREDPAAKKRRGVKHIWKSIERDSREQEGRYSLVEGTQRDAEDCIVVKG
jgi:hypothetical protein